MLPISHLMCVIDQCHGHLARDIARGVWGGGTPIFLYIRRFGQILNFKIFGGFSEKRIFLVYDKIVDILGVITKLEYFFGGGGG